MFPQVPTRRPRYLIDPVAFFLALIGAPVLVTLATFWIVLIPVFALAMGGPVYLITATPLMLWWLGRNEPSTGEIAVLGFVANLVACGAIYAVEWVEAPRNAGGIALIYLIFGSLFAPLWAAVFASLYKSMRRPFFAQTV